ncbi:protein translocase subunit yidC [Paludibacter propionicigenes WB4]|uniref:Membrane protein insertase YidC n=1 Tax=Paludibacter propionicigenes (strain DSM 17365 / JCM 13257 / WB4) TaxID=694427 RepID=E4T8H1_PALPW|nr:membrane protein insertase YidC [Paludibacter propionicigenes]ADQ81015.1 protein translocase subunit yidC [Paludibacter propionicigenes WB4]
MDKNTIFGFVLIAVIVLGYMQITKPSEKEIAAQKRYNDSIALVQQSKAHVAVKTISETVSDSVAANDTTNNSGAFGDFSVASKGEEKFYTLENELVKITLGSKGGRIYSVQLKKYSKRDSLNNAHPLILFKEKDSNLGFTFVTNNNRVINSSNLYFEPVSGITKDAKGNQTLILRLKTTGQAYIDFAYTLPANDYMLGFGIKAKDMNTIMPTGTNSLDMAWTSKIPQQEKGRKFEDRYSSIEYKYVADDVEKLSESKNDEKKLTNKVKWIAFKDQFFSSILIANEALNSTTLKSTLEGENSGYLKTYDANMSVAFDPTGKVPTTFRWYFGPNHYKTLTAYDKDAKDGHELTLNKLIPLGWGIFGWVNRFAIIPMFNFFNKFISNFGLIILLLTLVIKLVLFPLTYKSYMSSAKMRVLKPEIDEINARIPADKPAERQKATMELYGKVGVSPMSGCIPSLLQMPILFAMFSFFPAAIELRQQSFLWATDLSAYDSIMTLPFTVPFGFGNHVSLFCLLMTATNIVYTKLNMANQSTTDQPGGAVMKWMMYLMPVMFLFIFNNYASGLSYYYFIATLISIIQTYVIRGFVDEKKILAQLHAKRASNSKKPAKKGGFMERLEKMQREQQKAVQKRK